jgi:hypothetical protein
MFGLISFGCKYCSLVGYPGAKQTGQFGLLLIAANDYRNICKAWANCQAGFAAGATYLGNPSLRGLTSKTHHLTPMFLLHNLAKSFG